MPDEDKSFGGFLILDFKNWCRHHVKTIYKNNVPVNSKTAHPPLPPGQTSGLKNFGQIPCYVDS